MKDYSKLGLLLCVKKLEGGDRPQNDEFEDEYMLIALALIISIICKSIKPNIITEVAAFGKIQPYF